MSLTIHGEGFYVHQYRCQAGHVTYQRHNAMSGMPATRPCGEPGCSLTAAEPDLMPQNLETWSGRAYHECLCSKCGHSDRYIFDFKRGDRITDPMPCDECDEPTARAHVTPTRWNESDDSINFPYYDVGLGVTLHSPAHRREVARRMNAVPMEEGSYWTDMERERKADDQRRKEEAEWDEYVDETNNDPAFADYQRRRDAGDPSAPDLIQETLTLPA